jgi:hypothetical protein
MNYLYILTKQEFTSLYRYGKVPLILCKIIETVSRSSDEIDELIYKEFLSLPFFIGDEEYLIISFENDLIDTFWLEIENVSEIIPLTRAAKISIQMKFDTRLNFIEARFEKVIHKVEEYIDIQERSRGAKAFWNICQVKSNFENLVSSEVISRAYYNKIEGRKSSDFQGDFLVHLLSYDRYDFFPNSDLGFFYDIGEIFAHSKGKNSFVGSSFHSFLENDKLQLTQLEFLEIAEVISKKESIVNFTEKLTINNVKIYIASALFLKFKNDLAERDSIKGSETGKLIREIRRQNKLTDELNLAIYLTGSFFGYKKFYDDLYQLVDLKIFKEKFKPNFKEVEINITSIEQKEITKSDEEPLLNELSIESDISNNEELVSNNIVEVNKEMAIEENKLQIEVDSRAIENELVISNSTQNGEILDEKFSDQISIPVIVKDSFPKTSIYSKEYNASEQSLIELILKLLNEEKGRFELKTDKLSELKKAITLSFPEKANITKDDMIIFIKQTFETFVKVETKGNKCFISKSTSSSLFTDY